MKMKEMKKKLKLQQKRKEQKESDDSTRGYSVHDESEDQIDVDPNTCYKCGDSEVNSGWIRCQHFAQRRRWKVSSLNVCIVEHCSCSRISVTLSLFKFT